MNQTIFLISLIAMRLLPILVVAPIAPFKRAPMLVRVILSVSLAIILSGSIEAKAIDSTQHNIYFLLMSEFIIGSSLAFSFHAASAALHTMGQLIDTQIGFAAATLFDPANEQVASPTAELLTFGLLVTLIQFNIHYDLLLGFAKLLTIIPPGAVPNWNSDWLKILGNAYVTAFIIVTPVVLSLWLIDLILALISRSLPQAPIYFVALPIKVGMGIIILSWFFAQALEPLIRLLSNSFFSWNYMFKV